MGAKSQEEYAEEAKALGIDVTDEMSATDIRAKIKGVNPEPFTHVDRSNGQYLRENELGEKPHIGPVSKQATVEKLSEEEYKVANGV